jgi:alpha,alpha-trehalase
LFCHPRSAAEEAVADGGHYPGTYLGGGYNRLQTEIAGRVIENEGLVNWPNWLPLNFRIDHGPWFDLAKVAAHYAANTLFQPNEDPAQVLKI